MEEGPRKLFKTISLVDRLKGSDYDTILPSPPVKDKSGESSVLIKSAEAQSNTTKKGVNLAGIPDLVPKDPIILKTLIKSPNALLLPPKKFETSALKMSNIPPVKIQFANTISLEDRLNQRVITKTNHLPQYFLSDLYTGYLVIAPFLTTALDNSQQDASGLLSIPSTVGVVVKKQDPGTQLNLPVSENITLKAQGTFITNNIFKSISQVETPKGESATLITQGTYISNNTANTFVEVVNSVPTAQINQGSIELPIYEVANNQGAAIGLTKPHSLITIAGLQGIYINNGQVAGSLQQLGEIGYEYDKDLAFGSPAIKHGVASLALSGFEADKSKSVETPLAVHGSVLLDIIKYETDRALAFGSPSIKHGSSQLAVAQYLENRTKAVNQPTLLHGESIISISADPADKTIQATTVNITAYQPTDQPSPPDVIGIGIEEYNDGNPKGDGILKFNPNNKPEDIKFPQGSSRQYNSMAYGLLGAEPGAFEARYLGAADVAGGLGRANGAMSPFDGYKGKVKPNSEDGPDFIDLIFTPEGGTSIKFKAYLTSFSDGITANWSDIQYVGRIDTLKQYTGTTRGMSLSFLLPAFSKADTAINMKKLEQLISATVVGSFSAGDLFVSSPLVKIKVGNLIDSYCAVSTVKWDFDPSEATFDLDEQMPHMFKVSVDAAVLGTREDKMLNGKDGNYFGKSYA